MDADTPQTVATRQPRNTLSFRQNVARRILNDTRTNWPALVVQRLRREERAGQLRLDSIPQDSQPDVWATVQKTVLAIRSALADYASIPRRPGAAPMKRVGSGTRVDEIMLAQIAEPAASEPVPDPDGLDSGTQASGSPESAEG